MAPTPGGRDPPTGVFFYSRDRAGEHAQQHSRGYAGRPMPIRFSRLYDSFLDKCPNLQPEEAAAQSATESRSTTPQEMASVSKRP
jgi:hypothetical protein